MNTSQPISPNALLNPIFRFVGGRLIEIRCRFVGFDRNADEKPFGCFTASEQGG
jgi:hypothetical protein